MKRIALLALALSSAAASAANLNVAIKVDGGPNDGQSVVNATTGSTLNFRIEGTLSDSLNEGLALVGFDLDYSAAALPSNAILTPAGTISCANPMPAFVKPQGITNPAGFGGTLIGGDLIQVGGGQNTIKNTADNADFPIGAVQLGVAKPTGCGTAVIAKGSITVAAGTHTLSLTNLFANVIKQGETGTVFFATEAAGAGAIVNLQVTGGDVAVPFGSVSPVCDEALSRASKKVFRLTFPSAVPMPAAGQIAVRELAAGGTFTGPDLSASFTYTLESGNTVLKIQETGTALANGKWYGITNASWGGVGQFRLTFPNMPGNVNNDNFTNFADLSAINANMTNAPSDSNKYNINADNFVNFADLSAANSFNGTVKPAKPTGHTCP
jgi:hypothetical protein